jgi:glycosyltransferase involved in cell wall biosynthesis
MLVGAVYEPRWFAGLVRASGPAVASRIVLARQQPPQFVAAAYGAAEVFAFPSQTDTQALVLQEAALAGLPSVLADPVLHRIGPLGGRGVLAKPHPAAFADAISALLDEPARAKAVGAACAEWAARHTPAHYRAAISEVYHYACARAGSFNTRGRTRR